MPYIASAVLGLIKVLSSIRVFSTKRRLLIYVEVKSQPKEKHQNSAKLERLAAQILQIQQVTVIVLSGQKEKCSHTFLLLQLMKNNGLRASLKHGKLLPKTAILTSNLSLSKKTTKMSTSVASLEQGQSAKPTICVPGKEKQLQIREAGGECTVILLQRLHQSQRKRRRTRKTDPRGSRDLKRIRRIRRTRRT